MSDAVSIIDVTCNKGSSFFPRVVTGFLVDWDQREKRGRK